MPKVPAGDQPTTLYVKGIRDRYVKRIKVLAIEDDLTLATIIERGIDLYEQGRSTAGSGNAS